ncbi:MAG: YcnI family protein [Candidatus Levyibacteriota bacterium]
MKKIIALSTSIVSMFTFAVVPAFAHVIVHPSQVGVAAYQEFTMSVPTEKDNPTVAIKLMIPSGLKSVTPNVKPGWTIDVKKQGNGDDAKVTEIDWTGGSIPSDQRDDFLFQAQVPSKATTLDWKAYQTYSDGSVVSWDHDPKLSKGADDDSAPPPYSTTKVVNDLTGSSEEGMSMSNDMDTSHVSDKNSETELTWLLCISGIALILSIVALGMQTVKRKK